MNAIGFSWRIALFLALMTLTHTVLSQQPSYFLFAEKQFEGVDIYDIIQDKDNNYLFATENGVFLHDGHSYRRLVCEEMTSNSVFNFLKDRNGDIFCFNMNYQVFKISKGRIRLFAVAPEAARKFDLRIAVNHQNELIISAGNLFIFDTLGNLRLQSQNKQEFLSDPLVLKDGRTLALMSTSLTFLVHHNGRIYRQALQLGKGIKRSDLNMLNFIKVGTKYYAWDRTSKKVYLFHPDSFTIEYRLTLPHELHLHYLRFYSSKNYLWVTSSLAGAYIFDDNLRPQFEGKKVFDDYLVSSVHADHEGNTLLGTFDKGVLVLPNMHIEDVFAVFNDFEVSRITSDFRGNLFIGTRKGEVLSYSNGKLKVLSNSGIKAIEYMYYWQEQDILITDDFGFTTYDCKTKKLKKYDFGSLKRVSPTSPTELYGGFNFGLCKLTFDTIQRTFTQQLQQKFHSRTSLVAYNRTHDWLYLHDAEGLQMLGKGRQVLPLKIYGKPIFAIDMRIVGDTLYVASRDQGILVIHGTEILQQIRPKISGREVFIYMIRIRHNTLFVNTSEGLIVLDAAGKILRTIDRSAGVSSNKIIDFHIDNNYLWLIHQRGLQRIPWTELKAPATKLGLQVTVNGSYALIRNIMHFDYDARAISFEFKVATISNRENIQYHYRLKGQDSVFHVLPYEERRLSFQALPAGSYILQARLEQNGQLGPIVEIPFVIDAPIYEKWWFFLLLILTVFFLSYLIFKMVLERNELKNKRENELAQSKLTALRSQMNPHFIFNALNSIQDLVLKGNIEASYRAIHEFSELIRGTLKNSEKEYIYLKDELKWIEIYLNIERLHFNDDFEFSISYDEEELEGVLIPPMLIQPFVENAIVHGLFHKVGKKQLSIRIQLKEQLCCIITDNGIGRKRASAIKERQLGEHASFSVSATQQRFELLRPLFKAALGFEYYDAYPDLEDTGTIVHLKIPFVVH